MRSRYFSHSSIRKSIALFGAVFSRIYIARFSTDGTKIDKLVHVPIIHMPRSKMYAKDFGANSEGEKELYARFFEVFPRITFELTGLSYRSGSQLQPAARFISGNKQFSKIPVPYDLEIRMNVVSRDQSTALQVIEQILPYFKPSLTVGCKHEVYDDQEKDSMITLTGISLDDDYPDNDSIRVVAYQLTFTMKTDLFPYTKGADVELAKTGECDIDVEVPIVELCPGPGDEGEGELIERVIIDYHDLKVYPDFMPVLERETITQEEDGEYVVTLELDPKNSIPEPKV